MSNKQQRRPILSLPKKETRLYPPKVFQGDVEVDCDLFLQARANKKVGDTVTAYAGAPGVGHVTHRITRIDDSGVYGVEIENTIWVPEPSYFE